MAEKKQKRLPKLVPAKTQKQARVGKREISILKSIADFRFLTAEQICRLHFPEGSQSYCNARLKALFHKPHRLVSRHPLPMEWGKGSPKLAYSLTKKGADRLGKEGFCAPATYQSVYKLKKGTPSYKKHEVAVNEFRISADLAAKEYGWEIEEWITEARFKDPLFLRRMKVSDPETGRRIPVAPDGFFSLYFPEEDKRALFFLELDRGTMENARFRYKKIRGYHLLGEKWRELEEFRRYRDLPITFRVLTVVDGGWQRTVNLKEKCAEREFSQENREAKLAKSRRFYFTTLSDVSEENIFTKPIWLIPYRSRTEDERFKLIDFDRNF